MAIFGTEPPKWVYDYGGANEFTILFDYVYNLKFTPKIEYIDNESEINLDRDFVLKGTHWDIEFKMNLFKYSTDITVVKAKYDEILSYLGLSGTFWLHRDGTQFKKSDGSDELFILHDITLFYRDMVKYRDALIIKLKSLSSGEI